MFKSFFPDWDDDSYIKASDRLKEICIDALEEKKQYESTEAYYGFLDSEFEGYQHPRDHSYTKAEINTPLKEVKRARCEIYLHDAEFESIFKMSKEEFYKLKDWKRLRLKKDNGLW